MEEVIDSREKQTGEPGESGQFHPGMSYCTTRCPYCVQKSSLTYTEPPTPCIDPVEGFEVYTNRHSLTDLSIEQPPESRRVTVDEWDSYSHFEEDKRSNIVNSIQIPTIVISPDSTDSLNVAELTSKPFYKPPDLKHSKTNVRDTHFMCLEPSPQSYRKHSSSSSALNSDAKSGSSFFSTELKSTSSFPSIDVQSCCSDHSSNLTFCGSEEQIHSLSGSFTYKNHRDILDDIIPLESCIITSEPVSVADPSESSDLPVKCVVRKRPVRSRSLYSLTICPFYARTSLFPLPRSTLPLPIRFGIMDEDTFMQFYGLPRKYLPHVLRSHKLAKCLLALKLLMGIAICTIAGWLLVWAPHLPLSDVHYWSGLPALLSSVVGLILVCSCRKEYPGMPMASYVFFFKVVSVLISTAAAVACFSASCLAGLHLARLYTASCRPEHVLNAPCVCETDTALDPPHIFTYPDLNCPEVWNVLSVLLIATCCANGLAGFLASWYIYLHWASRYSYIYSQIRTSDNRPIVITNKT